MGWCKGTFIFDRVAKYMLTETSYHEEIAYDVLLVLAEELFKHDWDCESDSEFYDHPIVKRVMKQLDSNWDDYDEE